MKSDFKGIVISNPFEIREDGSWYIHGDIDNDDLRKYLLYWDQIDYPKNNIFVWEPTPELDYLISEGVVSRTKVNLEVIQGTNESLMETQIKAFKALQKINPGQWSLAQLTTTPVFLEEPNLPALEFNLWNSLPVPTSEVPFADIMEFKHRRYDELLSLRSHLDELYLGAANSTDLQRANNVAIRNIENSLSSIDRTLAESGISRQLRNLRVFVGSEYGNFAGVAGLAIALSIPTTYALAGAALITIGKAAIAPRQGEENPYLYASSALQNMPMQRG